MENLLLFLFATLAVGYLTFVLCYSKIGKPIRKFANLCGYGKLQQMLMCPYCTGFWLSLLFQSVLRLDFYNAGILGVIAGVPALAMAAGWLALKTGQATDTIVREQEQAEIEQLKGKVGR